jgi:protein-L-isoaspartate(D-aspartate) O-methyltransferase
MARAQYLTLTLLLACQSHAADWVDRQIVSRGVDDPKVIEAMRAVPRHQFVPKELAARAYDDSPLPIGQGQTISQPYIVAYMTEQLDVKPKAKVLEIGTGSGYQAAVLAELDADVYTIEIVPQLAERARKTLESLGYGKVHVRAGDGYRGWPEAAPFDRIIVTAAPDHIPQPLVDQLAVGGKMVIPVGDEFQQMTIIERTKAGVVQKRTIDVVFVPMTGEAQKKR